MAQDFLAALLAGFSEAVEPLIEAGSSADGLAAFLSDLGWSLDPSVQAVPSEFAAVVASAEDLVTRVPDLLSGDDQKIAAAITAGLSDVQTLAQNLAGLTLIQTVPPALQDPQLPAKTFSLLLYRYLERHRPRVFGILRAIGVLDEVNHPQATAPAIAYVERRLNLERLSSAVADPRGIPRDVYGWGSAFDAEGLLSALDRLATGFGLGIADDVEPGLALYYDASSVPSVHSLVIPIWAGVMAAGGTVEYGRVDLVVVPIPPAGQRSGSPEGLSIFPSLVGQIGGSTPIGQGVTLTITGQLDATGAVRAELRPSGAGLIAPGGVAIDLTVRADAQPDSPYLVIGTAGGSRLEIARVHAALSASASTGGTEVKTELGIDQASVVIDFSSGDGFLNQIFGSQTQRIDASASVTWSSKTGLRFGASTTPEVTIPLHVSLAGVVSATAMHVALGPGTRPRSAALNVTIDGTLNLGPAVATVTGVGLAVSATEDQAGNLGALDLSFAFKPPDGVGLAIDADIVVGGGFLLFDPVAEQYAGGIQLELAESLSLTAFGLLTTRLPDGSKGFSLLVLIDVEFTPSVQLGFGFTLDGVGGLIGVNRTVTVDVLRQGLRAGTLGSILFPTDPIRNAPRIISDLQAVFPAAKDRFLIGPMLKLGWGSPRLVTIELALILELPAPVRLIILGRLQVLLPEETHPVVRLHLDALGVIDFSAGDLSLDAVLYDSLVAGFAVTGGMALRANWGAKPGFVLAVGGFNPRFPAPSGFPALERVAISLATGDNPRLRLDAYLALTSNTVQFGARLDLYAQAGPFSIAGYLAFDVLIVLEPFGFVAQLQAGLALKFNGRSIMSISLDMTLAAPTPWHAWGKATFSMLFISGTISFDVSFGTPSPPPLPPPVSIRQRVVDALHNPDNWTTQAVDTSHPLASLRARPGATDRLVHPLADLRVVQHVVPLDRDIDRFGSAVPVERSFSLTVVAPTGASQTAEEVDDFFAPGEFRQMTDDQKLSAPAFESLPAGLRFGSRAYAVGGRVVEGQIDFTTSTLYRSPSAPMATAPVVAAVAPTGAAPISTSTLGTIRLRPVSPGFIDQVAAQGAASRSPLAPPATVSGVGVKEPAFAVAFGRGAAAPVLGAVGAAPTVPLDYMSAREALSQRLATASAERRYLKLVPVPVAR